MAKILPLRIATEGPVNYMVMARLRSRQSWNSDLASYNG